MPPLWLTTWLPCVLTTARSSSWEDNGVPTLLSSTYTRGTMATRGYTVTIRSFSELKDTTILKRAFTGISSENGCIENARPGVAWHEKGQCAFDSKLSIIRKNGKTYLAARANLAQGSRYTQITESEDLETWSNFRAINIKGVKHRWQTNIYYFQMEEWNSTHTAGIFPGYLSDDFRTLGTWITFSENMYAWSEPYLIQRDHGLSWRLNSTMDELAIHTTEHFPVAIMNRKLLTLKRKMKPLSDDMLVISKAAIPERTNERFDKVALDSFEPFPFKFPPPGKGDELDQLDIM